MALAPIHLPTGRTDGARHVRLLPARRRRPERLGHRDPLTTPSDTALRSTGVNHWLR